MYVLYQAENPTATTANKNSILEYLRNVKEEQNYSEDIATVAYKAMWKREVARNIAQYGIKLGDNEHEDLADLSSYISKVGKDFIPAEFNEAVNLDPVSLVNKIHDNGRWLLNIPNLGNKIKRLSGGQLVILMARPESGKTATIVNLMAAQDGFAAQGANTHLICNEEGADVTAGRAICCFNHKTFDEVLENPISVCTPEWQQIQQKLTFSHQPEISLTGLDFYCKTYNPDILIVDQLDHLAVTGNFNSSHERLGIIYRRARELAAKYNTLIIGVSQASAEAEGQTRVTYSMAEGSKTAKAAAADLIIGIGKSDQEEDSVEVLRYFHVSKNKISGYKGTVVCKLIQPQSRLIA